MPSPLAGGDEAPGPSSGDACQASKEAAATPAGGAGSPQRRTEKPHEQPESTLGQEIAQGWRRFKQQTGVVFLDGGGKAGPAVATDHGVIRIKPPPPNVSMLSPLLKPSGSLAFTLLNTSPTLEVDNLYRALGKLAMCVAYEGTPLASMFCPQDMAEIGPGQHLSMSH